MRRSHPIPERPNLSHDLAATLREMIFDGRLPAGERINEVHLAEALGVSRTPLREALSALVSEGALEGRPRRGMIVRALTLAEAQSIYPIRAYLDPEALRLSGIPSAGQFKTMASIVARLPKTRDVRRAIQLDDDWHCTLWENCPNPVLVELIEQFMRRTRRYELASMRDQQVLRTSTDSKQEIAALLRKGDLRRACRRLRGSLLGGLAPVAEWLTNRNDT